QTFTLTVNEAPTISNATAVTFIEGRNSSFTFTATGFPVSAFSETGTLPGGVTLDGTTGQLGGKPDAGSAGSYPITITAKNGVGSDATQQFTLTVLTPEEGFVRGLYLNELGRPGSLSELDGWVAVLQGQGGTLAAVAGAIARSDEARRHLVD